MADKSRVPVADVALATLMIAAGIACILSASTLSKSDLEPIGPAAFPIAVAIILIALAAAVLINAFRPRTIGGESVEFRHRGDLAAIMVGFTAAYVLAMQFDLLSFRWATVAYVAVLCAALFGWQPRKLPAAAILGLVMGLGLQYVFTKVLFLDLP